MADEKLTIVKSEPLPKLTVADTQEAEPTTYLGDVARYAGSEAKGFARGLTDLVNPKSYIDTVKAVLEGVKQTPAYVRGFSMDDVRRAPGQAADAMVALAEDPEALGRTMGNVVAGKAVTVPSEVVRGATRAAEAVTSGAKSVAGVTESAGQMAKALATQGVKRIGIDPEAMEKQIAATDLQTTRLRLQAAKSRTRQAQMARGTPEAATMPQEAPTSTEAQAVDSRISGLPPSSSPAAPPNTVRLYRGESEGAVAGDKAGLNFTDRPDVALFYSKRGGGAGRIYQIDVPAEDAAKYRDLSSPEEGTHVLPPELATQARGQQLGVKRPVSAVEPGPLRAAELQEKLGGKQTTVPLKQAVSLVRSAAPEAKLKLTAPEWDAATKLVQQGHDPEDVMTAISVTRELQSSSSFAGLPTDAQVESDVAARNATGRWGAGVGTTAPGKNPFR